MTATLVHRVAKAMNSIAPLKLAESAWDNVGILLEAPFPRPNATRVFLTIDLTQPVLDEALSDPKVGVIVSYHPPIFKAMKRLCLSDEKQAIALKCAAAGVSIYAPHTALDNCVGGINDWLSRGLGAGHSVVINPTPNPLPDQEGAGSGRLHTLDEPVALEDIVKRIKAHLQLDFVRVATARSPNPIKTVAICAGSGSSVLNRVKADLYLTGEMSHHDVLSAVASNTSVIVCEHSNSERGYLADVLQSRLHSALKLDHGLGEQPDMIVDVVVSSVDADPLVVM
ncbi:hypothetical protein HDV00_006938 [Rhizophlyctis rosea]|nr:hypothetical protein HDV00_006938 [Rhizophlyctis rosea]